MQNKSTRAFRTISEASEELDLKPHVLRFWEAKFPDLSPVTRGGGRRFYRPEDVDFLRGLRILLHEEKHKIKDVQKLIKVKGAQSVVELGHSAVDKRPSRPIEKRNLVPDRIKPSIVRPKLKQAPTPKVKTPAAKVETPELPNEVQPTVVPFTPSAPAKPALTQKSRADLEGALGRLSSLRSRWEKFEDPA